jgi:hypothetical protein
MPGEIRVTLPLGDMNAETWSSRLGPDARLTTSLLKKIVVTESKEVKAESNLAQSAKKAQNNANNDDYVYPSTYK